MFVSHTREEQLFESFAEIAIIVAYPHEAGLDDVGHNHFVFFCSYSCTFSRHTKAQTSLALVVWLNENVRFSTLIVWEKGKCYIENEEKVHFLRIIAEKCLSLPRNN